MTFALHTARVRCSRVRGVAVTTRCGSSLVELLVALPILAIIGAIAIAVLLGAHKQARKSDTVQGNARELRHGGLVMATELRPLQPGDLIAWTDTSLEFQSLVGVGIACDTRVASRHIDMLPAWESDPARTAFITTAQPNDRVVAWRTGRDPGTRAAPFETRVASVASSTACAGSPLRIDATRAIRLHVSDSSASPLQEGTPVRITRRVRYALYRASDGNWFLGRRSHDGTDWDVVQPVIGPLLSAASRGVNFVVTDSADVPLASGATSAAAVRIRFRAARVGVATSVVDSTAFDVALRGRDDD
jgi:type II secretory pathway pseudopilin PulG